MMNSLFNLLSKLYTLLYSLYFCIRVLPLKIAIKVPIYINPQIELGLIRKKCITINNNNLYRGMIKIGFESMKGVQTGKGYIYVNKNAEIIFEGSAIIAKGVSLVLSKGKIIFGDEFYCNANCFIRSNCEIKFGRNVLVGWNVIFNTTDGHTILHKNMPKENFGPINIGNHVWIASHCNITKNAKVSDHSVIAQQSLVTKKFDEGNLLIGGIPAKIISRDIDWKG